ncbi:MAG: hypothetical protein SWK76_07325 [Actinomycetota bacterium]|nr:hypothetical protein [Actinomycetota bacterium]
MAEPAAVVPSRRGKIIAIVVIVALLVIVGGVAAFLLTRDGGETMQVEGSSMEEESQEEESSTSELERARDEAQELLEQANDSIQELRGMGIDTSDLEDEILNAQSKFDTAESEEDYIGDDDSSAYYSNLVIEGCEEKKLAYKQAEAAEEERNRQLEKCRSDVLAELKRSIDPSFTYDPKVIYMDETCTYAELAVACTDAQGYPCQGFRVEAQRQGDTWVITNCIDPSEEG